MTGKIKFPDTDQLIEHYLAGTSVKQLADQFGTSRTPVIRVLRESGIHLRSRSEAELLKWQTLKKDRKKVERQCGAAWAAARKRVDSLETKIQRAVTAQDRLLRRGLFEDELSKLIRAQGLPVQQQLAIGAYNLDLAVKTCRLAVEIVCGGGDDLRHATLRKRTKYVLDQGWALVFVPLRSRSQKLDPGLAAIANQLVALAERTRRNKSLRGQYGVIGRHGKPTTYARRQLNGLPRISCL